MKDKIIEQLKLTDRPLRWLAEQLGINQTTLWRKMTGQNEFKQSELMAMSLLFDVPVSYFTEE